MRIRRQTKKALAPLELPRVDKNNPQEIAQRLRDYFEWAIENDVRPTLIGMGTWLGVNRQTLYDWRQGRYLGNPDSVQVIQNAVNCLEAIWADQMLDGDLPPAAGIFIGINHKRCGISFFQPIVCVDSQIVTHVCQSFFVDFQSFFDHSFDY